MTALRGHLDARRGGGRRLLVPYTVAGLPDPRSWADVLACVAVHADAVEVGIPYSDPLMDGPVIAAAAQRAIAGGVGPLDALSLIGGSPPGVPRIAMTYYNPIHRIGEDGFCRRASEAGAAGLIVPDLPVEESAGLRAAAAAHDLAWIPLVAPSSSPQRIEAIAATATGFVYAVARLGVTGVRESLAEGAAAVARACRAATDLPVLVGIGVSTPAQAVEAAAEADGVVIGSAVVTRILDQGAEAAEEFLGTVRAALDALGRSYQPND